MQDIGIQQASKNSIANPLPMSWLGLADAPTVPPDWAAIPVLSPNEFKNLKAQIAYDYSQWDYSKLDQDNNLGRYQFSPVQLENYGVLAADSNYYYGLDCINYQACWQQNPIRRNTNAISNYLHNITSQSEFLSSKIAQEQLADQLIYDYYNALVQNGAIVSTDSADTVAGMIYVAWQLGVGSTPGVSNAQGTGAYSWRYFGNGNGTNSFNSGRYSITVLTQ